MTETPTPQEALDIVTATTQKARTAYPLPAWQPPLAGIMGAAIIILFGLSDDRGDDRLWLAAMALGVVFFAMMCWLWALQRKRGIKPRYPAQQPIEGWKRGLWSVVPTLAFIIVSDLGTGWMHVVIGVLLGGYLWIGFARQRAGKWPY
ncbi:hypothetical protein [Nocardia sp. CDC160]|uniref:hypothetical protein n=1 Tax=Nocardia sp. CDC160 TaxID=3112166 RepID=UPI002DBCBDF7|nr:hypothetical protein [Nocardia sp. CDC160]MEC3918307.1 hypothetical protein [Nocardia sp. CDC160]